MGQAGWVIGLSQLMPKIQLLVIHLPSDWRRARGPRTLSCPPDFLSLPLALILSRTLIHQNPAKGSALKLLTAWVWGVLSLALIKYFSGPRNR